MRRLFTEQERRRITEYLKEKIRPYRDHLMTSVITAALTCVITTGKDVFIVYQQQAFVRDQINRVMQPVDELKLQIYPLVEKTDMVLRQIEDVTASVGGAGGLIKNTSLGSLVKITPSGRKEKRGEEKQETISTKIKTGISMSYDQWIGQQKKK